MGIKTGFNDAFLLDTATKERLVAGGPEVGSICSGRTCAGRTSTAGRAEWAGLWMLAMKSSGNHPWPWAMRQQGGSRLRRQPIRRFTTHLDQYRDWQLQRSGKTRANTGGSYETATYTGKSSSRPKVMYQEIHMATRGPLTGPKGMLANNTVYLRRRRSDIWTLAVAKFAADVVVCLALCRTWKDEALRRCIGVYVQQLPDPAGRRISISEEAGVGSPAPYRHYRRAASRADAPFWIA